MKKAIVLLVVLIILTSNQLFSQKQYLQSGPMIGYVDVREALIWVQTNASVDVSVEYWEKGTSKIYKVEKIKTEKQKAFVAKFICDSVLPGKTYNYAILINGKRLTFDYPLEFKTQELWKWRKDPPEFKFITGSCFYVNEEYFDRPGKPYGGEHEIVKSMYAQKPDFMLWLGDNLYLREGDWDSWTGIIHRYTHTRSIDVLQPFLASVPQYAITDDHDYGPNDSDRGFWNKKNTMEAFKLFWGNPSYGFYDKEAAVTFFSFYDADFFLLDNRTFRSPNDRKHTKRTILGDEQIEWLIDNLVSSKATFKFVVMGGQFLNPYAIYENYSTYPEERQKILDYIEKENIQGVIFISGDRHHSELTKLDRPGNYPLLDLTSSTITAGPNNKGCEEPNYLRVEGSCYNKRNYVLVEISGKKEERKIKFTIIGVDGKAVWSGEFKAIDLQTQKSGSK